MSFVAVAIAGSIGGSLLGAGLSSSAAKNAANTQANSANYAANLQKQASDQALAEQKRQFNIQQGNLQPWMQAGQYGLSDLLYGMGMGSQSTQPPTFTMQQDASGAYGLPANNPMQGEMANLNAELQQYGGVGALYGQSNPEVKAKVGNIIQRMQALSSQMNQQALPSGQQTTPTAGQDPAQHSVEFGSLSKPYEWDPANNPSYQFRLNEGADLVQNRMADKGMPFGGTAAKALTRYGQDYASQEYQNDWGRYQTDLSGRFNRLASIAGIGQTATGQANQASQMFANNASNTMLGSAAQIGDLATQAANARASGYVGSANAWGGALGNIGNNLFGGLMLNDMFKYHQNAGYANALGNAG